MSVNTNISFTDLDIFVVWIVSGRVLSLSWRLLLGPGYYFTLTGLQCWHCCGLFSSHSFLHLPSRNIGKPTIHWRDIYFNISFKAPNSGLFTKWSLLEVGGGCCPGHPILGLSEVTGLQLLTQWVEIFISYESRWGASWSNLSRVKLLTIRFRCPTHRAAVTLVLSTRERGDVFWT